MADLFSGPDILSTVKGGSFPGTEGGTPAYPGNGTGAHKKIARAPDRLASTLAQVQDVWWTVTFVLMGLGLIGAVIPVLPDSLLILAGAYLQHFTIHSTHTVGWWTLGLLTALSIIAHIVDFSAGAVGAKKFGASRWGALGGLIGGLVGLFFFPVGLFVGPILGVLAAEILLARKALLPAARSSWGTLLGTMTGMIAKLLIDVTMVGIFLFVTL